MYEAIGSGIDPKSRRIWLHGDVAEGSVARAIRALTLMDDANKKPVELWVSSCGGDLDEVFALHDVMRIIPTPVHTIAVGKCMSAAVLPLAAGKKGHRWTTMNCRFMVHDATLNIGGEDSPQGIQAHVQETKLRMKRYSELLAAYTDKPARFWSGILRGKADKFFGAEDALEWGLVDSLWEDNV